MRNQDRQYPSGYDLEGTGHCVKIDLQESRTHLTWPSGIGDIGFAPVAGDTNAYEAWPPDPNSDLGLALHEVFLAGWGMPIGEVWDLEHLAKECERRKKWSFFLTSQPLDIPGGIASPTNALVIL